MGAAAHNRGSRLVSREADERMPVASRVSGRRIMSSCRATNGKAVMRHIELDEVG